MPDLWGRIEAGLKEKSVAPGTVSGTIPFAEVAGAEANVGNAESEMTVDKVRFMETSKSAAAEETRQKAKQPKKKKTIYRILPWVGAAAAAALILVVALPTIILVSRMGAKNSATTMETANVNYAPEAAEYKKNAEASFDGAVQEENADVDLRGGAGTAANDMTTAGESAEAEFYDGVGGIPEAVGGKNQLKTETFLSSQANYKYVRIQSIYEIDGRTFCLAEIAGRYNDFASGERFEAAVYEISADSVVEPEEGAIFMADILDNGIKLLIREEE